MPDLLDTTGGDMHKSSMSEGKASREATEESAGVKPSERATRPPYEAPRIARRIPVVRNTLGQPPGGPGSNASGSEAVFGG